MDSRFSSQCKPSSLQATKRRSSSSAWAEASGGHPKSGSRVAKRRRKGGGEIAPMLSRVSSAASESGEEEKSLLDWVEGELDLRRAEGGGSGGGGGAAASGGGWRMDSCEDRVLHYVVKRSIATDPLPSEGATRSTTGSTVVAFGQKIPVTVTNEAAAVEKWLQRQSGWLFGLDVEWRPNRKKGMSNKVALLQICGDDGCLIIQLLFLDKLPDALAEFLLDARRSFAGVGIGSDAKKLEQDHGLVCVRKVEITQLAVERLKRCDLQYAGLKSLVKQVLDLDMTKPKHITLSNWDSQILNRAQVEYACIDAWASFAISEKLLASCL